MRQIIPQGKFFVKKLFEVLVSCEIFGVFSVVHVAFEFRLLGEWVQITIEALCRIVITYFNRLSFQTKKVFPNQSSSWRQISPR